MPPALGRAIAALHAAATLKSHPAPPRPVLRRYYLNGNDAFRLKLLLPPHPSQAQHHQEQAVDDEAWVAQEIQRLAVGPGEAGGGSGGGGVQQQAGPQQAVSVQ